MVAGRAGPRTLTWVYGAGVLAVTSFGFWQLLREVDAPLAMRAGLALLTGCLCMWGLLRFRLIADLAKTMAWAGVIFPLLFITDSRVSLVYSKARPSDQIAATPSDIASSPPIVLVVFDELPLWTLVGPDGRINHHRYPNFSRFANKATWFVNGGTVVGSTRHAIPAILTGRFPTDRDAPATPAAFPDNLFSWLQQNAYRLVAAEYATRLCPEEACEEAQLREARLSRWSSTAADLRLMVLHRVCPPEWEPRLPSIASQWRDFGGPPPSKNRAVDEFLGFVQSIDGRDGTFYFLHSRLPHVPWIYTARGARYERGGPHPGLRHKVAWNSDAWVTGQAFQRHILQTQFTDRLFGRLLDRLESEGVFDRALVMVMADHGTSFRPNTPRRALSQENWNDIIAIPFFVKRPFQKLGQRSDRYVASIDVAETIADVLGKRLPWLSDGQSVFKPKVRRSKERKVVTNHGLEHRFYPVALSGQPTIQRKLSLFGSGEDPESIFRVGDVDGLVGRRASELEHETSPLVVVVRGHRRYQNVSLRSGRLPVWMRGRVLGQPRSSPRLRLAISLNGTIVAVTKTFIDDSRQVKFAALLPEAKFRDGVNTLELFVIKATAAGLRLARILNSKRGWKLRANKGRLSLVSSTGQSIPVRSGDLAAGLTRTARGRRRTHFVGWAVAIDGGEEEVFAAFVENGVAEFVVATSVERHGIARRYLGRATDDRKSGFRISVPNDHLKGKDQRLFVFTSKSALEIPME